MKKFYYICLKLLWYFLITVIATTYKQNYGWLFLVVCAIILAVGDAVLSRLFKK
ncbi:hypothetical protein JK636_18065 [Clostridium sp. YIM B02515]|uniref:Uncharacterized protein n=1 Tax=Clostridium rhizosphaerae TaxID=2803861 RepID=A0ABS1TH07_9CLOT|nr:hypothetical protein [Clostridium rhizosphaerae]MBL4937624.1 hypothetical protein [Clostridium rhizosphaerae]